MGRTAFIFPGQGSQYVGMGKGLWDSREDVRRLYEAASGLAGEDLAAASFGGPKERLDEDLTAQLCVLVCNEAHRVAALGRGVVPDVVTGYSLGFYSAAVAAGSLGFAEAVEAVMTAGALALRQGPSGTMGAIIGLDLSETEGICKEASAQWPVWVSNVNAARQMLVSGSVAGVGRAVSLALSAGALSAYALPMGAAYHSPMMEGAAGRFSEYLSRLDFSGPSVPILSHITAQYLARGEDVRRTMGGQLSSRVLWKDSVLRLVADGVDRFIEMGPGSALTRMVRWVDRDVEAASAESLFP